jgi:hypothetical protein
MRWRTSRGSRGPRVSARRARRLVRGARGAALCAHALGACERWGIYFGVVEVLLADVPHLGASGGARGLSNASSPRHSSVSHARHVFRRCRLVGCEGRPFHMRHDRDSRRWGGHARRGHAREYGSFNADSEESVGGGHTGVLASGSGNSSRCRVTMEAREGNCSRTRTMVAAWVPILLAAASETDEGG